MIGRMAGSRTVSTLLLALLEARGDLGVFCYRMGVRIFSAGQAHVRARSVEAASAPARIQVACSTLFSIFSTRFLTQKD